MLRRAVRLTSPLAWLIMRLNMNLSYTFWEAKEGGYIGFINQFPDYWTQGDSVEELESMLSSLYEDIMQFDDIQSAVPERTGQLAVAV